jgi:pimeloyl-ACP methyl ester carboxylesterase
MSKKINKRRKKVMTIFAIILFIIFSLNVFGFIINKIFFSNELDNVLPYGKLIEVNGKNMHVYSMGEGEKTIVLLPGLGVALPSADFGPLMRKLSKNFKVVCIEYFGVGFSDKTETSRTNENYTQEIRTVLNAAGFSPPYILMPHSASGIYSEYYATKYPNEISAIIMLDTTSSAKKDVKVPKFVYNIAKIQQATGLSRIINSIVVPRLLKESNGYTKKEISDYKKFMNQALNDTIINQNIFFYDNVNEVMTQDFPNEIPVLKIVPTGTIKQVGEDYQKNHIKKLGENAQYTIFNGSHFIYHTNIKEIYDTTVDFLLKY